MPQGSALRPLLLLLYINDLHVAIKHCKVHHFTDDTNLLIINKSLKRLNKLFNSDLRNLTNWLNASKISLNVSKTELIIFKPKRKPLDFNMNGKRLFPTDSVKYLGVKIDSKLNWKSHANATDTKLKQANVMLCKVRDFVNANILKSIYYALFESHINYACILWRQNISTINCLYILQKKALRIINFKERNAHSSPLFHYSKIIKIADKVKIENCLFINKYTNNKLPSIFTNWCTFSSMSHNYQTSFAPKGNLQIPSVQTTSYRKKFFVYMVIKTWNDIQKEMKGVMLNTFSLFKLKSLLYLNMYKTS